jgi:hypothetical protein
MEKFLAVVLGALDHALDCLGTRDRGGVRDALINQRATLAASIAALESLAGDGRPLGDIRQFRPVGLRYRELAERYELAYAAQQQAKSALHAATRETIQARRTDLDAAEADAREVSREIDALRTAAVFPTVLLRGLVEPFAQAEQQTTELARLAGAKSQPARALFAALEQGRTAPAAVARLWICFEPAKDVAGDLMAWRLRAYNEEHGQ